MPKAKRAGRPQYLPTRGERYFKPNAELRPLVDFRASGQVDRIEIQPVTSDSSPNRTVRVKLHYQDHMLGKLVTRIEFCVGPDRSNVVVAAYISRGEELLSFVPQIGSRKPTWVSALAEASYGVYGNTVRTKKRPRKELTRHLNGLPLKHTPRPKRAII